MEIKTCEQYVIAELEEMKRQVGDNIADIGTLEHDIEEQAKDLQILRDHIELVGEAGDEKFMMLVSRQKDPEAFGEIAFITGNEFLL